MAKTKKAYKLNIFEVLDRADRGEFAWFDFLPEDDKKEVKAWLIQRWLSSKKLQLVNEITNPFIGSVPTDLTWRLFCAIGIPGTKGYKFPPTSGSTQKDLALQIISERYGVSQKVAKEYRPIFNAEDLVAMAESMGWDDKEIKALQTKLEKDA
jgi:hypothetical protein